MVSVRVSARVQVTNIVRDWLFLRRRLFSLGLSIHVGIGKFSLIEIVCGCRLLEINIRFFPVYICHFSLQLIPTILNLQRFTKLTSQRWYYLYLRTLHININIFYHIIADIAYRHISIIEMYG